jgi:hypothetical protein
VIKDDKQKKIQENKKFLQKEINLKITKTLKLQKASE